MLLLLLLLLFAVVFVFLLLVYIIIIIILLLERARARYLSFFSLSFNFTLWSAGTAKSTILQVLFFVDYYKVWSSGWDLVICLYIKIPEEFVSFILQDGFWVVHMPFVHIVKFKFLAQFPVDCLAHPVISSLILFPC